MAAAPHGRIRAEGEKYLPEEQQYGPWTSDTAKLLGDVSAKVHPDLALSPRKMENALRGWFNGMGRHALSLTDLGSTWRTIWRRRCFRSRALRMRV